MDLELYSDPIILDSKRLEDDTEDVYCLDIFMRSAKGVMRVIGVEPENKVIFYKHNDKNEGVLGVQLGDGNIEDINNYVLFDYKSYGSGNSIISSVDMHASGKISESANMFTNLAASNVSSFFSMMEMSFIDKEDKECDYMRRIKTKEKNKGILSKIFKRK